VQATLYKQEQFREHSLNAINLAKESVKGHLTMLSKERTSLATMPGGNEGNSRLGWRFTTFIHEEFRPLKNSPISQPEQF